MQETPQEYIQRILAQLGGKDPLKVQAGTAAKLKRLVQRASPAKLRKRPAPGKWSAAEILEHLAAGEPLGERRGIEFRRRGVGHRAPPGSL